MDLPGIQESDGYPFENAADVTLGVVRENENQDTACAPVRAGSWWRIDHALLHLPPANNRAGGSDAVEVTLDDSLSRAVIFKY